MADFLGLTIKMDPVGDALRQQSPPPEARTNLSALTPEEKRRLWERLKQTDPELADLLRSAYVQQIIREFDAAVMLPASTVHEALHDLD